MSIRMSVSMGTWTATVRSTLLGSGSGSGSTRARSGFVVRTSLLPFPCLFIRIPISFIYHRHHMIGSALVSFQEFARFIGILHEKDETLSVPFADSIDIIRGRVVVEQLDSFRATARTGVCGGHVCYYIMRADVCM